MIIKGEAFTVMYETRNYSTGALVADTGNHTITIYYQSSGAWTSQVLCNAQAPAASPSNDSYPAFLGSSNTGVYTIQIPNTYTDSEHIILTISTTASGVVIPSQQFYPVDLGEIADKVWGRTAGSTDRVLTGETSSLQTTLSTINTAAQKSATTANSIATTIGKSNYISTAS